MRAPYTAPDVSRPPFAVPARPSKYRAVKTVVDNIEFASKAEARRYGELKLLEKGGYIRQLELQPVYPVVIEGKVICKYIADFRYFEGSQRIVEDIKGMETPVFRLKRKLVEALYPGVKILVVK